MRRGRWGGGGGRGSRQGGEGGGGGGRGSRQGGEEGGQAELKERTTIFSNITSDVIIKTQQVSSPFP